MPNAMQKRCRDCGKDVANQKRTKDGEGNYYCQPCYAARSGKPAPSATPSNCTACGTAIVGDAAFCGRCGAKRDGHRSLDESIDMSSLIVCLGKYGEYSQALSMVPGLTKQMLEAVEIAKHRRDQALLLKIGEQGRLAQAQADATTKDCEEARSRLAAFDQEQVRKIRDMVLVNDSVSPDVKAGLRYDALGLWGPPQTTPPPPTAPATSSAASRTRSANLRNGMISVAIFVLVIIGAVIISNIIDNNLSMEDASTANGWAKVVIVPALLISAILSFVFFTTYATTPLGKESVLPVSAPALQLMPRHSAGSGLTPQQKVYWAGCVVGCLTGAILLVWGGWNVLQGFKIGPETGMRQLVTGGIQVVVGFGAIVISLMPIQASCPSCRILNAAELCDATLLDRHLESEAIEHKDHHYDIDNKLFGTTTRQGHKIVTVDTVLKEYLCKHCGHRWEKVSKSRT